MTPTYVGRFAPSPTGAIHLGVARTALVTWLDARAAGGRLVLRIEDVDRPRVVPDAIGWAIEDLRWLGLDWDEGPDVGGPQGPYLQSARDALYLDALARLDALGRTFPCTCSRREVLAAASAPHGPDDDGPRYPGTCRDPTRRRADRPAAIRLATRPGDVITHRDRLFGDVVEDVDARVGDFVVRRADGLWAYQLAVTVDDLLQGVTCVVRGRDLLASTARQALLRRLLAPDAPPLQTLHVPLVVAADGRRLAKRDADTSVRALRAAGVSAEALVGRLAESLGLWPSGEPASARALLSSWDPARLRRDDAAVTPPAPR